MIRKAGSALLLLSAVAFAACEEDPSADPFLSVTQREIEVEYDGLTEEGESISFELGSNRSWVATYVESWIELTHIEGDRGRVNIFVDFEENNTKEDRIGFIVFEGQNGIKRTITVTQKLKVDRLSVSPLNITVVKSGVLEDGDKASVYMSTNCDWTITRGPDSEWINPAQMSGKGNNRKDFAIDLDVDLNTTGAVRTGTLVVAIQTDNDAIREATVTVTQNLEGLNVSETSFEVNRFGYTDYAGTPLTFTVRAAEEWTSVGEDWLTVSPSSGGVGETRVTLVVEENTTGSPRTGEIKIVTNSGIDAIIEVNQNELDEVLYDDGKAIGFVYYSEPFDWAIPFGMKDQVGLNGTEWTRLSVQANDEIKAAWAASGLTDINPSANCLFIQSAYLHLGGNAKQTGVLLPALDLELNKCTDVELTIETCANIGGSGNPDGVTITIEIVEGPGTVDGSTEKLSAPMTPVPTWSWTPMSAKLYGVTADTKIVVRSTQWGVTGYYRWFLDNIEMTKIANQ